jgi:hypothetical protein
MPSQKLQYNFAYALPELALGAGAKHEERRAAHSRAAQVQDNLEASFVSEAEMVFTTLSSTGRKVCTNLCAMRMHVAQATCPPSPCSAASQGDQHA